MPSLPPPAHIIDEAFDKALSAYNDVWSAHALGGTLVTDLEHCRVSAQRAFDRTYAEALAAYDAAPTV